MTRGFSRRNLVKGAAWAAPAVVASTAIPAYSASIMDLAPCLHFDLEPGEDSAYGLRQYMHEVAPERAPRERAVEDITIPDGVSYMRFYIEGGQGGGVDMDDYSGGSGGYGAEVSGVIAVTPAQKYRFYLAAGGIGHYYEPADGGDGYTRGGSSALMPEYVYEDSDKERMTSADYNRLIIYSGSGGGSSALVLLDGDAETLIAVAGGGGGGGARGIIATSRTNLPDGAKMPTWRQFDPDVPKWAPRYSPPYLGNGGDGGESKASKPSKNAEEVYAQYGAGRIIAPSGATAGRNIGRGARGGSNPTFRSARGLSFTNTPQSQIRSRGVAGAAGGTGDFGHGGDGVAAYGYVTNIAATLPENAQTYDYNVAAYIVSGGGGGGYGGGGSGAAVVVGAQTTDQLANNSKPQTYAVSAGAVSGAGGAGGNYVNSNVLDAHVEMVGYSRGKNREEFTDGTAQYSFCPSRNNQIDHDGKMYPWP